MTNTHSLFIHNNHKILQAVRDLHRSMIHKDIMLTLAFDSWDAGIIYSSPTLCVTSAKQIIEAVVNKRASLLKLKNSIKTGGCGAITKEELNLLAKINSLGLEEVIYD